MRKGPLASARGLFSGIENPIAYILQVTNLVVNYFCGRIMTGAHCCVLAVAEDKLDNFTG